MNANTKSPSIEQYIDALTVIAGRADSLSKVCEEGFEHLDYKGTPGEIKYRMDQLGGLLSAARDMALVIGYMADQHDRCGYKGGAEKWFMPPTWISAAEPEETV